MSLFASGAGRRLAGAHSIEDLRGLARRALPRMVFDFVDGAAGSESTARANRGGLEMIGLVPGPLRDVSARSPAVDLFGKLSRMPVIIGPTGFNSVFWPRGDVALARAASKMGIPFVMSWGANVPMTDIRADTNGRHWFQINPPLERDTWKPLVTSALEAGFEALEITVDTAVPGRRLRDMRNGFGLPLCWTVPKIAQMLAHPAWSLRMVRQGMPKPVIIKDVVAAGARYATISELVAKQVNPSVTWDDLKCFRDMWTGPLIVKGLCNPRDIASAIAAGYDGAVISNHGGRQIDGAVGTIDMLPECAAEARGRITLLIDGGFRSGTDVLKALALGATAVQVGRATIFGLAAGGQPGVERALTILLTELDQAMALSGAASIADAQALATRPLP